MLDSVPTNRQLCIAHTLHRASLKTSVDDKGPLHALIQNASSSNLRQKRKSLGFNGPPTIEEYSVFHDVRPVNSIDYSVPATADASEATGGLPIGWSQSNALPCLVQAMPTTPRRLLASLTISLLQLLGLAPGIPDPELRLLMYSEDDPLSSRSTRSPRRPSALQTLWSHGESKAIAERR